MSRLDAIPEDNEYKGYEPELHEADDEENKPSDLLPPFPRPLLEWTEEEKEAVKDIIDSNDPQVIRYNSARKLHSIWHLYGSLVNDQRLSDIVNKPAAPESDKFYLQHSIVALLDKLGKVLSRGHVYKEICYLQLGKLPQEPCQPADENI